MTRYRILGEIGRGGMAEVFLAETTGMGDFTKKVVLKLLLPSLADDEEFVTMFVDEARIVSELAHPNIVQVHDLGMMEGRYFIAMEYVNSATLARLIKGPTTLPATLAMMQPVLAALDYAHEKGIVHRDVTPYNILVSREGVVKVTDFGIAKGVMTRTKTRTGVLKGQFRYMSPEQAFGKKVDPRSDIFSAGLVAYELLTGRAAYDNEDNELALLMQARKAQIKKIDNAAIMKALSPDPDKRFTRASEFAAALAKVTPWDRHQLSAWVAKTAPIVDDEPEKTSIISEHPVTDRIRPRPKKWHVWLAMPFLVVVVAVVKLWPHESPPAYVPPQPASIPVTVTTMPPPPAPAHGFITINARPWAVVFVDGVKVADTPMVKHRVLTGEHVVELVRKDGVRKRLQLDVTAGENVTRVVTDWR